MQPFSIYMSCKELMSGHLQQLTSVVAGLVKTDVIYLLGASLHHLRSESIFCPESTASQHSSGYYFLILLPDFNDKQQYEWQDQIEQHCSTIAPVTTIVLKTTTFEQWLAINHPFAIKVVACAPVIYNSGIHDWPFPEETSNSADGLATKQFYRITLARAREFYTGANLFKIREQFNMSAFMLHQATEQSLRALLKFGTGYHSCTHNLERLIRYVSMVNYQLHDILPGPSSKDKSLFKLLQKAYSDTRYTEDYSINCQQLSVLMDKVSQVLELLNGIEPDYSNKSQQA